MEAEYQVITVINATDVTALQEALNDGWQITLSESTVTMIVYVMGRPKEVAPTVTPDVAITPDVATAPTPNETTTTTTE